MVYFQMKIYYVTEKDSQFHLQKHLSTLVISGFFILSQNQFTKNNLT